MNKYYNIEKINKKIMKDVEALIKEDENKFNVQLKRIVNKIQKDSSNGKVILVAGPSSAGKTTFSELLKKSLTDLGFHIVTISMDNFFIDRRKRKRLSSGDEDFESLNIVNLDQLKSCFDELFERKTALFPVYDFENCVNIPNQIKINLEERTIIIFEGIHCLNPALYKNLGNRKLIKIFISNERGYRFKKETISPREMRFIRRVVRDREKRNTDPLETYALWPNIINAEKEYIFPFKKNADFVVDSSHSYELALYKKNLVDIKNNDAKLFKLLDFMPVALESTKISKEYIPENSLMWEFVKK